MYHRTYGSESIDPGPDLRDNTEESPACFWLLAERQPPLLLQLALWVAIAALFFAALRLGIRRDSQVTFGYPPHHVREVAR